MKNKPTKNHPGIAHMYGAEVKYVSCRQCKGEGWLTIRMKSGQSRDVDCEMCNGTGFTEKE